MELSGNLRADYLVIHRIYEEFKGRENELLTGSLAPVLVHIKERVRNTLKEIECAKRDYAYYHDWHYNETCDYRWCKIVYDFCFESETIKEYREHHWQHWYNPYEDGRDCTGVWFTTSIYVFPIKTENKTVVFHFQACDI